MSVLKENIQNFGKIKNAYNTILSESIIEKNDSKKKMFSTYLKTINENEILKLQFLVYNNIETLVESDKFKANQFIYENLNLLSKFSKQEIYEANKKLASLIELKEEKTDKDFLYENISTLIFTEKTPNTISKRVDALGNIVDYITNNKPKTVNECIELPLSLITSVMVEKYNERYSTLNEDEKEFIRAMIDANDESKISLYTDIIKECVKLIDSNLNETTDLDTKDRLLRVKDKLLNIKPELNEDYVKNVAKLFDLRENLKLNND